MMHHKGMHGGQHEMMFKGLESDRCAKQQIRDIA